MQAYYRQLQSALVKHFAVDEEMPFADLPESFKKALYFGTGDQPIEMNFGEQRQTTKRQDRSKGLSRRCSGSTRKPKANLPATASAPS